MNNGIELAKNLFDKFTGIKPTRVKLGHGSFITMDFGLDIPEQTKTRNGLKTIYFGEWHLWIYMCAWRIDKNETPFIGCESPREKIESSLSILENKKLTKVDVLNKAFDAKLIFEEDIELHLFSFYTEENKQWMLFTPEKKVFTAGPGSEWSYHDSDKA